MVSKSRNEAKTEKSEVDLSGREKQKVQITQEVRKSERQEFEVEGDSHSNDDLNKLTKRRQKFVRMNHFRIQQGSEKKQCCLQK